MDIINFEIVLETCFQEILRFFKENKCLFELLVFNFIDGCIVKVSNLFRERLSGWLDIGGRL
jgi:hypothetical protein